MILIIVIIVGTLVFQDELVDDNDKEDNELKKYISKNPEECKLIQFLCTPDRIPFYDETGCGCELIPIDEECPQYIKEEK